MLSLLGVFQLLFIYGSFNPIGELTYMDVYILDHWKAYALLGVISILSGVLGFWLKYKAIPIQLIVFAIFIFSQYILPPNVSAL